MNAADQVELRLKAPWRDGATHLLLSPLEFLQRQAAGVQRPQLHLIRYHGVLAPNARLRARVVPQGPAARGPAARGPAAGAAGEIRGDAQLKIIAAILQRAAIGRILTHPGSDPRPPPRGRASEAGHAFAAD